MKRAALALMALVLVTGCSPIVSLQPADDATAVACADVIVALPKSVARLDARETNAQATAAWGNPATVILRCGVPTPPPTSTSPCLSVEGVDWLRDDSGDPNFVFTTYGRSPAIEVIIDSDGEPDADSDGVSGLEALTDLSLAVSVLPKQSECTEIGG